MARSKTLEESLGFLGEPSKKPEIKFTVVNLQDVETAIASLGSIE